MTPAEYTQFKAFARIDGLYLGLVWTLSFALYILGLQHPASGMAGTLIALASPFFATMRLRSFRDKARGGFISFRRAIGYYIFMFLYASLVLALAQYVYFAFIDGGYMLQQYTEVLASPEGIQMMKAYGLTESQVENSMAEIAATDPIYIVLNFMSLNILAGTVMSLPAAALIKRAPAAGCGTPTNN